jgi:hypothetical protein
MLIVGVVERDAASDANSFPATIRTGRPAFLSR